jgi:glycosyltransferase involved in cell wall biosynthesis
VSQPPLCSIVVPTRGRVEQLHRCLRALAELDYDRSRYEVIVVDDGGDISLNGAAPGVALVHREQGGPAAARNTGAAQASGELLAFTDDDCRPRPDWLRLLVERAQARPGDAVGGRTVNALRESLCSEAAQLVLDVGYAHLNSGRDTARFFTTNNLLVPAEGFRDLGGFDESFRTSEDREFCSRWVLSGRRLVHEPGAVIEHSHVLDLAAFCRLHWRYGRGAFRYHELQRRRTGRRVLIEPRFYGKVAVAPFRQERGGRALALAGLIAAWQASNTAGFVWEWAVSRR